jgi:tRNA (adenine22-N1)-methyltransferase
MRKRLPKMSPRLKKIYNLAEGEPAIWDVGTDHGYLPVSLILGGGVGYAVASDINRGPIESASATAQRFGVEDKMELRLCDGLSGEIPDRLSTVIIAGMGGETIINICENAPWIIERNIRLLLQPMTSIAKLREFIYSGKYRVLGEHLIQEKDKIYVIMDIVGGGSTEHFTYLDTRIGKYTIKEEPYRDYLSREIIRLKKESRGADEAEKRAIESAVEDIKEIIKKEVCIDGNNQSGL